ncbi:MAG: hypothetical protein Kow00106_18570 [Anaerolineae bacterium]
MSPLSFDNAERVTQLITDAILSSEKVRDGLRDDEAIPLVEWGLARARHLATRLAPPLQGTPDEEQIADKGYALTRLMTRLNWLVTYRFKKDAEWLTRTFQMINQLSRELYGDDAPVFSDEEIAAWLAGHASQSNAELLAGLMARLTPERPPDATPPTTSVPPAAPVPPATPASPLPGRPSSGSPTAPSSPSPLSGDEYGSPE